MGIGDIEPFIFTRNYFDKDMMIQQQLLEHYNKAIELYGEDRILGVFLCGSQNYKLDYDGSDVDTKCIIIPSIDDIVLNHKPVSTIHVMENNSHLELKDIRLYWNSGFRKQNINFVEILFTDYFILNNDYKEEWETLRFNREAIARLNPTKAVKSMAGQAKEKFAALEKRCPSQEEEVIEFGWARKQLHHLLRIEYFLEHYINGEPYEKCLVPSEGIRAALIQLKATPGLIDLIEARARAVLAIQNIEKLADDFCEKNNIICDEFADNLLNIILTDIMKKSLKKELI